MVNKDKLEDCKCLQYNDKIKIIGALGREINRLEKVISTFDKTEGAFKEFKDEIIPEYDDLIKKIGNTPDCEHKFD